MNFPAPRAVGFFTREAPRRFGDRRAKVMQPDSYKKPEVIEQIDKAIESVSSQRAQFGAVQNRLEHTLNNLAVYQENLSASESRIRDVDILLIVMTRQPDLQTGKPKVVELQGRGHRWNPSN